MIKSATSLLLVSSIGVILRTSDIAAVGGPYAREACLAGLCTSLVLYIGFYFSHVSPHRHALRAAVHVPSLSMLKYTAWKHA